MVTKKNKFRSKLEELTAKKLESNEIEYTYESTKLSYDFPVRGGRCTHCDAKGKAIVRRRLYLPDFVLRGNLCVEAKGILDSGQRSKFLAIKKSNPEWVITFVFGADNKLAKRSKLRYSDWCDRHGFPYGIKELPPGLVKRAKKLAASDRSD